MKSKGEQDFINLPDIAARLYDYMMGAEAIELQYCEIARDLASLIDLGRLLDIGTGPGRLLLEIHRLNPGVELYGLDVSEAMLRQAKRNLNEIGVDLRLGNIRTTNYASDFFDLITCTGSFYLWDSPVRSICEIHRILKRGRTAYLYETHRDFDEDKLKNMMRDNLRGENIARRSLSPRFLLRQLSMTYSEEEIAAITDQTHFAKSYSIEKKTISGLPIWLRIELKKCT